MWPPRHSGVRCRLEGYAAKRPPHDVTGVVPRGALCIAPPLPPAASPRVLVRVVRRRVTVRADGGDGDDDDDDDASSGSGGGHGATLSSVSAAAGAVWLQWRVLRRGGVWTATGLPLSCLAAVRMDKEDGGCGVAVEADFWVAADHSPRGLAPGHHGVGYSGESGAVCLGTRWRFTCACDGGGGSAMSAQRPSLYGSRSTGPTHVHAHAAPGDGDTATDDGEATSTREQPLCASRCVGGGGKGKPCQAAAHAAAQWATTLALLRPLAATCR